MFDSDPIYTASVNYKYKEQPHQSDTIRHMDSARFPNSDIYKDTKVLKTDYKQYLLGEKTQCIGRAEYNCVITSDTYTSMHLLAPTHTDTNSRTQGDTQTTTHLSTTTTYIC
jgi:hypothetical protein